jgi:hypothetical protein
MYRLYLRSLALFLLGAAPAAAADPPGLASCWRPVMMTPVEDKSRSGVLVFTATAGFVQEGPNLHLYICELRMTPRIASGIDVNFIIRAGGGGLVPGNLKFNPDLDGTHSQLVLSLHRPLDQTEALTPEVVITIQGKPAAP